MQRLPRALFLSLLAVAAHGCAENDGAPIAPTSTVLPAQPAANAVTVAFPMSILKVGESRQASATATLSNGAAQSVATGFRTDTAAVTITETGVVTGALNGNGNINVVFGGAQGTRQIRVVPDYQGTFLGTYEVTGCSDSGVLEDACSNFASGTRLPIVLEMTQPSDTLTVISRVTFGAITMDQAVSAIRGDGSVPIDTTTTIDGDTQVGVSLLINQPSRHLLTGELLRTFRVPGDSPGGLDIQGRFLTVIRGASVPAVSSAPLRGAGDARRQLRR